MDCIVLSFYLLQSFFMNEVTRGMAGQGSYHLHQMFLPLMDDTDVSEPAFACVRPHDIVSRIRDKGNITSTADDNGSQPPQNGEVQTELHKPPSSLTQLERARIILQTGKISFDPKLHLFNVLGSGDRPYVVRLFPRESCSCPSSGLCYHINAVKMSIGSDIDAPQHRRVNLTMLRKKTRSRKDKTSGRKRPRKTDTDRNPTKRQKKTTPTSANSEISSPTSEAENSQWLQFLKAFRESKRVLKQHQHGKKPHTEIPSFPVSDISSLGASVSPSNGTVPLVPYSGSGDSYGSTCSTPTKMQATPTMQAEPCLQPPATSTMQAEPCLQPPATPTVQAEPCLQPPATPTMQAEPCPQPPATPKMQAEPCPWPPATPTMQAEPCPRPPAQAQLCLPPIIRKMRLQGSCCFITGKRN